jgi:hypothetical protein
MEPGRRMSVRDRLTAAAVILALAVLALVVVLVFAFGRHDPSPPALTKHPNDAIPGELLYIDSDGCIVRAAASGARREQAYCLALANDMGGPIAWVDDHTVGIVLYDQRGAVLHEIDLATKQERDTGRIVETGKIIPIDLAAPSINGESVSVDEDGGVFVVKAGVRTKVADFDVAEYNAPRPLIWSPDGGWILLQYYPRNSNGKAELWILSRDGATKGTIATDARGEGASWRIAGVGITPTLNFN